MTAIKTFFGNLRSESGIPTNLEEGDTFSSTIFAWSLLKEAIDRIVS
jgi:hypothetical protein